MMGLLSSIGNIAKKAAENFTVAIQKPVSYVSSTISDLKTGGNKTQTLVNTQLAKPLSSQIGSIIVSTGTAALAVVGGGAAAGSKVATKIVTTAAPVVAKTAKSLLPSSTKGKVVAAVVAPVAISAVASNPLGAAKTATKAVGAQIDLGKTLANPTKDNLIDFVKEHPVATGVIGAGTLAAVGGGIGLAANTVATALNTRATNETATPNNTIPAQDGTIKVSYPTEAAASPVPVTPQTAQVSKTSSSTKKRRKKAQKPAIMQQKVNVMVNNSTRTVGVRNSYQNKNYINRELYN